MPSPVWMAASGMPEPLESGDSNADSDKGGQLALEPLMAYGLRQIQRPLFHFLHQSFWYWSNQSSLTDAKFTKLCNIWLKLVRPWRSTYYERPKHVAAWADELRRRYAAAAEERKLRARSGDSAANAPASGDAESESDSELVARAEKNADVRFWHEYIVGNLAFYTVLGRDAILAAADFDFTSSDDRRVLARFLRGYGYGNVCETLQRVETALFDSSQPYVGSSDVQCASRHLNALQGGVQVDYVPLFCDEAKRDLTQLARIVGAVTLRDHQNLTLETPAWWEFWETQPKRKPPSNPPTALVEQLVAVFELDRSLLLGAGGAGAGGVARASDAASPLGGAARDRALQPRIAPIDVPLRGNEWQRPVMTFESRAAVRTLYRVASAIEQRFGVQLRLRPLARKSVLNGEHNSCV